MNLQGPEFLVGLIWVGIRPRGEGDRGGGEGEGEEGGGEGGRPSDDYFFTQSQADDKASSGPAYGPEFVKPMRKTKIPKTDKKGWVGWVGWVIFDSCEF